MRGGAIGQCEARGADDDAVARRAGRQRREPAEQREVQREHVPVALPRISAEGDAARERHRRPEHDQSREVVRIGAFGINHFDPRDGEQERDRRPGAERLRIMPA